MSPTNNVDDLLTEGTSKGNPKCFLCRLVHVLPFARCGICDLPSGSNCPSLKAGVWLFGLLGVTGSVAFQTGGRMSLAVFVAAAVVTVVVLLFINTASNDSARDRLMLNRLNRELVKQQELFEELSPLDGKQQCMDYIVESTASRLRCGRVSIMLLDEPSQSLYIAAAKGLPEEVVAGTRIPVGERICGKVFQEGRPVHLHDVEKGELFSLELNAKAYMSAPLMLSGMRWGRARIGVLSVTIPIGREDFSVDDEFVLSNICHVAAVAIHNQMAIAKVHQSHVELLQTLAKAMEARDQYTCGHSERVCEYAVAIGQKLGLDTSALDQIRVAALLHDLGKIGIPDAILNKPGKLTAEELQLIRQHPTIATEMLESASTVGYALDIIVSHHERYDGGGYPHGRRGESIPLFGRIISTADVFDALTSARPYRTAMTVAGALEEMNRGMGTQFDPTCLVALMEVVGSGNFPGLVRAAEVRSKGRQVRRRVD